jgi:NusA-like KH domain protein
MAKTIDMQFMRYINLFEKISRVSTMNCFVYNNTIFFAVPKTMVSQAIGPGASNVRRMSETLRKKIKVITMPNDDSGMKKFVEEIVEPIKIESLELTDGVVFIGADREGKAMLIGRNRVREQELTEILSKTFKVKDLKIG